MGCRFGQRSWAVDCSLLLWAVVWHVGLIRALGTLGGRFGALDTAEAIQQRSVLSQKKRQRSVWPSAFIAAKALAVI